MHKIKPLIEKCSKAYLIYREIIRFMEPKIIKQNNRVSVMSVYCLKVKENHFNQRISHRL